MGIKKISNTIYELYSPHQEDDHHKRHTYNDMREMLKMIMDKGLFGIYKAFSIAEQKTQMEHINPGTQLIAHSEHGTRFGQIDSLQICKSTKNKGTPANELRANISVARNIMSDMPRDEYEVFISSDPEGTTLLSVQTVEHIDQDQSDIVELLQKKPSPRD